VALGTPRDSWRERGGWMGGMMLMTLLNRCYRFKGFVYPSARFAESGPKGVEVQVWFRCAQAAARGPIAAVARAAAWAMTACPGGGLFHSRR
jgi:hypothetical protein